MDENEQILQTIFSAIDELNPQLDAEQILEKSLKTPLFGKSGKLDSLGLVTLCVTVEQKIEEDFGIAITIADERAMSQEKSPFLTVETLADYVGSLLKECEN